MTTPLRIDGVDISHHQAGAIDFAAAKKAGVKFVYHKATEGNGFRDTKYVQRRAEVAKAGLPFGAYHFARPEIGDAEAEARHFLAVAQPKPGDLLPVLDLETTEGLGMTALDTWAGNFARTIHDELGVWPMIYTPYSLPSVKHCRLWVARYSNVNAAPVVPAAWDAWDLRQFSDGVYGVPKYVAGIGNVDLNILGAGVTVSDLRIPAKETKPPKPPTPSAALTLACHNLGPRNPAPIANVGKMLNASGLPIAATLQEASDFTATVVDAKGTKYRVVRAIDDKTPRLYGEVSDRDLNASVVLVRADVNVLKVEARQVPGGAWTWNDNKRVARVWVRVVCELDGQVFEVWSIHRCPGGPWPGIEGNRAAWAAEDAFLVQWVGRVLEHNPGRPIHLGGDWNTWPGKMPNHAQSIENLGRRLGAGVHLSRIDGFLSINAPTGSGRPKGKPRKVKVRKLVRKFGSDAHRPVVVTFP